ncbi:MAG: hypothetical protein ACOC1K_07045 [Nanoarchaeota archaeon]
MKELIVKISPNTGIKKGDYIIDPHYGLIKAINNSSMGMYNQVTVKLIPKGTKTTVSIFNGVGLYKISLNGEGIGSGVDQRKAIQYLFK